MVWYIRRTKKEISDEDRNLLWSYENLKEKYEEYEDDLPGDPVERMEVMEIIVSKCRKPRPRETSLDYSRRLWSKVKKRMGKHYSEEILDGAKQFICDWFNQGWWLE